MIEVNDAAQLTSLPDGTIIEWVRIPGDDTSTAVAYLHHETAWDDRPPSVSEPPRRTTWISPGGWQPMTIEEAGITYPVKVVRLGDVDPQHIPIYAMPEEAQTFPLLHGGTWAREKALECAVHRAHRFAYTDDDILRTAETFEAWLEREVVPEPPEVPKQYPREAGEQRQIDIATGLINAYDSILEAREEFGGSFCTDAALRRMIETAASVYRRYGVKVPDAADT